MDAAASEPSSTARVTTLSDHVEELLDATGRIARRHFRGDLPGLAVSDKGDPGSYDPVTAADREIEAMLRAGLSAAFPRDRIVGEEQGDSGPSTPDRTWYLDPIDGTKAFLTGMTGWGTLVGLVSEGRAVAGWMDQPVLRERFSAVNGVATRRWMGAHAGDADEGSRSVSELRVSDCRRIDDAILYTTHPSMFGEGARRESYDALGRRVRLQRFGGDCYAYCMLAAGRVDLIVESQLNAYDIVALIPIIEASGGVISGPDGSQPLDGGTVVAAASRELAEQAWELLGR